MGRQPRIGRLESSPRRRAADSQTEMGAGIAASPHFPKLASRAGEGVGTPFGRGSGRSLSAPVGPLGPKLGLSACLGPLTGLPPKSRDFAGFPVEDPPKHRCLEVSLRGSFARGPGFRRTVSESGFGLRLALLPRPARSAAVRSFILADKGRFRGGRRRRCLPFPEGRSSAANHPSDSAPRVAPSGIFRLAAVENVNPVDKSGLAAALPPSGALP